MSHRGFAGLLTAVAVISMGPAVAAGQPGSFSGASSELRGLVVSDGDDAPMPRTPWGHPDLQGLWNNSTTTPLERMTAEEQARGQHAQRAVSEATGGTGAGWLELGGGLDRASLIIDPPDGRIPISPAAVQRLIDRENARSGRGEAVGRVLVFEKGEAGSGGETEQREWLFSVFLFIRSELASVHCTRSFIFFP